MQNEITNQNGVNMPTNITRNPVPQKQVVMSTLMLSLPEGNDELLLQIKKELQEKTKDIQGRSLRVILQA